MACTSKIKYVSRPSYLFFELYLLLWQLRRSAFCILPLYSYIMYFGHYLHPCKLWARMDLKFMNSPRNLESKKNVINGHSKLWIVMEHEYPYIHLDRSSLTLSIQSLAAVPKKTPMWFGAFLLFERYLYLILFNFHLFYNFYFHQIEQVNTVCHESASLKSSARYTYSKKFSRDINHSNYSTAGFLMI